MVAAIFSFVFKGEALGVGCVSVSVVRGVRLDDVRGKMHASPQPACFEYWMSAPEIEKSEVSPCFETLCACFVMLRAAPVELSGGTMILNHFHRPYTRVK